VRLEQGTTRAADTAQLEWSGDGSSSEAAPGSNRWVVLGVTALAAFMAFLDVTIVNIAFPSITSAFPHTTLSALSWVLNAYNVVLAALLVPAGRVADLLGRRRMLIIGLILFTGSSLACALSQSIEVLIAARAVQGAGAAILIPASVGLLLRAFPFEQRATAVGLWSASAAVASAVGPTLGAVLIHISDWRLVFLANLPIGLLAVVLARRTLTESRDEEHGAISDLLGTVLVIVGIGLLALGIAQGRQWGWGSAGVVGSLAGGMVVLALFVARCATVANPVIDLALLRERTFATANAGTLVFASAFYALLLCNVLFLTEVWRYSILQAGFAFVPSSVTAALIAGPAGRVADRYGYRVVTLPGIVVYAIGVSLFLRVGIHPSYLGSWLPATVVMGAGVGLASPALAAAAASALPPARFATGTAINASARQIGGVLGIAILVAILGTPSPANALHVFDQGWTFIIAAAICAVPACLLLP
jgi:EmrB/QacA subfamily drug resistance transporter